jgi:excinuclease ABC subunit B
MHAGDRSRKQTLIDYGFRLPSALDNRPLTLPETLHRLPQIIFTSATPNDWELAQSQGKVAEQLIRPTGLLDPTISVRPTKGQIDDLITEIIKTVQSNQRVLVTTLTKKMAEALTDYLNDPKKIQALIKSSENLDKTRQIRFPKVAYLHSDIETLDRSDILDKLRGGEYDVLVGINLLREGLDLPEVSLVAILDADKEGFLRSRTSLVQTMGRAARHYLGRVIMYADKTTPSMVYAISETSRRRKIQSQYNQKHHLKPTSITKPIRQKLIDREDPLQKNQTTSQLSDLIANKDDLTPADLVKTIKSLESDLKLAAKAWDFETAALLRDAIKNLKNQP